MRKRPEMRFHPFLCAKVRHYDENWSALHKKNVTVAKKAVVPHGRTAPSGLSVG